MNRAAFEGLQSDVSRFKHIVSRSRIGTTTLENRLMISRMAAGAILDDTGWGTDEITGDFEERKHSRPII
jgi:uncharacterized membrane protein YdcZ (DUF606 family)